MDKKTWQYIFLFFILLGTILIILGSSAEAALTDGLYLYYNFDECIDNANLTERVSGIYNLTRVGTLNSIAGKINCSRDHGTAGSYFYNSMMKGLLNFSTTKPFTISFWAKFDTASGADRTYGAGGMGGWDANNAQHWFGGGDTWGGGVKINYGVCAGTSCDEALSAAVGGISEWTYWTIMKKENETSRIYLFRNGTILLASYTSTKPWDADHDYFVIGGRGNGGSIGELLDGSVDEFGIWNRSLSDAELSALWNNGTGYNPINTTTNATPPTPPVTYNYSLSQNPADINSSTTGLVNVTLTVTPTTTILSNSSALIYYQISTSLNNGCAVYYQTICNRTAAFVYTPMTKINDSYFRHSFDDNDYLPGYYPYNYEYIQSESHRYNYTVYLNHNVKFNVFNMSTNASQYFIGLEFAAVNKTGTSGALAILYCNSSYSSGSPLVNPNCVIVDSFVPNEVFLHLHNISRHYFLPVVIRNITKTQNGSFIFIGAGNAANGWNFEYMLNNSYNNRSFHTGSALSWDTTNYLFDIHFHSYWQSDFFTYYTRFYDGNTSNNQTYSVTDWYNITQYPPSIPYLYTPECNAEYTVGNRENTWVFVNHTPSIDINGDFITLEYCLYDYALDSCLVYAKTNDSGATINNSYNLSMNLTTAYAGTFYNFLRTCDQFGFCDLSIDLSCPITVCVNNWIKTVQPCVGGVSIINYTDAAGCLMAYDTPLDNGMYENCSSISYVVNTLDIDDKTLLIIILVLFMYISFITASRSSGYFKGGMYALCGVFMLAFSFAVGAYYNTGMNQIETIFYRIFPFVFGLIGLALILLGVFSALEKPG